MYSVSCHGLQEDYLAKAFVNNGAIAFMGWSETNSMGDEAGFEVFKYFLDGHTLEECRNHIVSLGYSPEKLEPLVELRYYPDTAGNFRLIEPDAITGPLVYSSNFNNNVFDANFWTKDLGGDNDNDIRVEDGVMKLEQNQTDVKTSLLSKKLAFNNSITLERDVFLSTTKHYWSGGGGDNKDEYFYAETVFNLDNGNSLHIGYHHDCWHSYDNHYFHDKFCYHVSYANGERDDWTDFPLSTILDSWFYEKIVLNKNGKLQYYINNSMIGEHNIGEMTKNASSLNIHFSPYGWWTGHKHYFDNFKLNGN